jgi:tetratricopeptide (TPR) repeat protein
MYGRVSATLGQIAARPAPPAASPSLPQPPAAAAAKPSLGEPVLQVDEGLRYVQEMEKADLLFEKGQHYAAAAGYRRALDILPESWNDGAAAFRLGECYLKLADCPSAIAAYERVALAPRSDYYPQALLQIGETHLKLKAYARAREAFYSLLLLQGRFGAEAAPCVERAYYRVADTYWLEAQGLAEAKRGTGR